MLLDSQNSVMMFSGRLSSKEYCTCSHNASLLIILSVKLLLRSGRIDLVF